MLLNTFKNEWKTCKPLKCNKFYKWTHCISPQTCSMFSISITVQSSIHLIITYTSRSPLDFSNVSITSPDLAGYQVLTPDLFQNTNWSPCFSQFSMSQNSFSVTKWSPLLPQFLSPVATTAPCIPDTWNNEPFPQLAGFFHMSFHHVRNSYFSEWRTVLLP